MDTSSLFFFLALAGLGVVSYFLYIFNQKITYLQDLHKNNQSQDVLMEWLKDMRTGLDHVQGRVDKNLGNMTDQMQQHNKDLNERLDNAAKVVGSVSKELGQMSEIGRQMRDLQDFLRSPKLRGNMGEQVLRDLLEQVLPRSSFSLQHSFREGKKVDAIVKTDRGIIPIDSKFPLESFTRMAKAETEEEKNKEEKQFIRDVKKHINDISKKYILPQEGTVDFALMYVPSEPIYYEMVMSDTDVNSFAHEKKVLLVSPNSFYYFLRIVMMGLQEKQIAEGARKILSTLEGIRHEAEKFDTDLGVLSGHVSRTKNAMDSVAGKYQGLYTSISQVQHLQKEEDALLEETLPLVEVELEERL